MENKEKKVYSVIGKVEIGTDEYRDLIEGLAEERKKAEENNTSYWKKYNELRECEEKLKKANEKLAYYQEFVESDEVLKEKLKTYHLNKKLSEMEEGQEQC